MPSSRAKSSHTSGGAGRGKAAKAVAKAQQHNNKYAGMSQKELAADRLFDRQIDIPLYMLLSLLIMHALSGTSSLSLAHLSTRLPYSLQQLIPTWLRHLPSLTPFASDLPNASHDSKMRSGIVSVWDAAGAAGPFRSEAAGFGHPLSALHSFTRACLGLSYALPVAPDPATSPVSAAAFAAGLPMPGQHQSANSEPWAWLVGGPGVRYSKGGKDALFVCTWILIFTALRAATIKHMLVPLGNHVIKPVRVSSKNVSAADAARRNALRANERRRIVLRFAEQGWSVLYYIVSWGFGLYISYHEPYWMRAEGIFEEWPVRTLDRLTKFYYLAQCGFWFQQLLVIETEARRKDYYQMFAHHIVTITLITGSYVGHFTRVGTAVLVLMDPSDILLSGAKCLRYSGFATAVCDTAFAAFMVSWVITRHVFYNMLLAECMKAKHRILPAADAFARIKKPILGFQDPIRLALVALLCFLQFLLLIWFGMILRVLWRVVTGKGAADSRSDEDTDEEEERLELQRLEEDPLSGKEKEALKERMAESASSSSMSTAPSSDRLTLPKASSSKARRRAR